MSQDSNGPACCPLCGSIRTCPKPGYQHIPPGDWSLYSCAACGTSILHPIPDAYTLKGAYGDDYYGSLGGSKFVGPVEHLVLLFRYLRARSIRRLVPTGRILDVGCGRGLMLTFLKRWGCEVNGVELDTIAAFRTEKNLNQKVFHSLNEVADSSPSPYQAICFWHSLEHMPDPGKILKLADDLLAPGGVLVIAAPHLASIQSRLAGIHWLHLDLPRHVVHFDMRRLAAYLHNRGYDILRHDHLSLEYNVIDMLCQLYCFAGFPPLYPFNLIREKTGQSAGSVKQAARTVLGTCLVMPLNVLALLFTNLLSAMKSGSTTTLFLRKCS